MKRLADSKRGSATLVPLLVTLLVGLFPILSANAAEAKDLGQLSVGEAVFDQGAHVEGRVTFWELCDIEAPCWHYTFDVVDQAETLRVAIDYGERDSRWAFRVRPPGESRPIVFDPSTDLPAANFLQGPTTLEIRIPNPSLGVYNVSVAPVEVQDDDFRFRALLQDNFASDRNAHAAPKPMLPNMVPVPPFKFTFVPTVNGSLHAKTPDRAVAGQAPMSCTEDETRESGATECLRFGAGGFNLGDGPLRIKFDAYQLEGTAWQVILHTNGSTEERDAGTYFFHDEHQHFHYAGALDYELFAVTDEKHGGLVQVGEGHKTGYCMVDFFIADWFAADDHAPSGPRGAGANCGMPYNRPFELQGSSDPVGYLASPYEGRIGWTKGWGDLYPNWRTGQYVDFSGQPDGLYLVRATLDGNDRIEETNERDNVAYALVEVTTPDTLGAPSRKVEVLERGRGESPWDPHKELLSDRWI